MKNELKEIRNELLIGVENEDLLYIKMQINKLDTLLYNLNNLKKLSNESKTVRDNETKYGSCKGCKYYPRHLLRTVCAECDDWENYELIQ